MHQIGATPDHEGNVFAIKILRPELADDPLVVARFVQERAVLTRLAGQGIVRVVDLIVEGQTLAIVMDLVTGGSLRQRLNVRGGVLPVPEAAPLIGDVLVGLESAHALGVVHRDIKPENILLESGEDRESAVITDFGISGLTEGSSHTRMTSLIGTPEYMAPELLEGEPAVNADRNLERLTG